MSAGHIYAVATADLVYVTGVAFDHAGNLLLTNPPANQVLAIAARSGPFYGQTMTAGGSYAIAGTGQSGLPNR